MGIFRTADLLAALPPSVPLPAPPPQVGSPWASADALSVITWAGLLDGSEALPVTRQQVIALPAVARGRDLIAVSVARMPLAAVNSAGRLADQPRIMARPEVGRARFNTLVWTVDDLIFTGRSVWLVTDRYAEDGRPRTARYAPPSSVETDTEGNVVAVFTRPIEDPRDVIRFDGPHEGILTRANETVRTTRALFADYARAVRSPNPDIDLHQTGGDPLSDDEISALITWWTQARATGRVAYTNQSVEARALGQQPENLLVAARHEAALDLARHMGLPAWAVDAEVGGSSLTYQNVPSRSRELIDYTLAGYMEAITGRLSLDDVTPAGVWAAFSTDTLTDGDFAARMAAAEIAIRSGVYTAEQMRAREAGAPLESAQGVTL